MSLNNAPQSYDDRLHAFKDALNRVLSGAVLPPMCAKWDLTVTLALLDIAHAVREGRPSAPLVTRACAAFALYAPNRDVPPGPSIAHPSKLVT